MINVTELQSTDCLMLSREAYATREGMCSGVVMIWCRECRERFPRHHGIAIPTCITARAWRTCRDVCRDRQLTGFIWSRWRGKRSRHSRRMRNPQFYVSVKRPIEEYRNLMGMCCRLRSSCSLLTHWFVHHCCKFILSVEWFTHGSVSVI